MVNADLRLVTDLVQGDIMADHTPEAVDESRQSYGPWSIQVPIHLIGGTREITHSSALKTHFLEIIFNILRIYFF